MGVKIEDALVAAWIAYTLWYYAIRPWWPWDSRGRRKALTLKRRRRPWE